MDKYTILLVDDEEEVIQLLSEKLIGKSWDFL